VAQVLTPVTAAAVLAGCKTEVQEEQAKNQSTTISLFGGTHSATVQGHFTKSEWAGVVSKIETAFNIINEFYVDRDGGIPNWYETVFARNVTINIEKSSSDYTKWKTTGDGKTMYLNYGGFDNDLYLMLDRAITRLSLGTEEFVKATPSNNKGWQRMNRQAVRLANARTNQALS